MSIVEITYSHEKCHVSAAISTAIKLQLGPGAFASAQTYVLCPLERRHAVLRPRKSLAKSEEGVFGAAPAYANHDSPVFADGPVFTEVGARQLCSVQQPHRMPRAPSRVQRVERKHLEINSDGLPCRVDARIYACNLRVENGCWPSHFSKRNPSRRTSSG